jgi:hypothetical protein
MELAVSSTAVSSKRAAVFLFSSAGELDVILPALQIDPATDFKVIVFKPDILERITADGFYSVVIGSRIDNRSLQKISRFKLVRWIQFLRTSVAIAVKYFGFDEFYFEYGRSGREKNILIPILVLLGRSSRIRYHPHGHAVTADDAYSRSNRPLMIRLSTGFGSKILRLNGAAAAPEFMPLKYPILNPVWGNYISRHVPQLYDGHVVILSRDVHPAYLLEENRIQMFRDVLQIFEKWFPNAEVVVKAHPREQIEAELFGKDHGNVTISYDNTYSVVRGARFAVSFWTSAFFQCIALGVPVVEYHIPHDAFHDLYPAGSLNKTFVPTFQEKRQLEDYIRTLHRGSA